MSTPLKNIQLFDASGCLSREAFEAYLSNTLAKSQAKEFNQHINNCDFCKDALEGLSEWENKEFYTNILDNIDQQIDIRLAKKTRVIPFRKRFLVAASIAAAILIMGGSYIMLNKLNTNGTIVAENKSVEKQEKEELKTKSTAPIKKEIRQENSIEKNDNNTEYTPSPIALPEVENNKLEGDISPIEVVTDEAEIVEDFEEIALFSEDEESEIKSELTIGSDPEYENSKEISLNAEFKDDFNTSGYLTMNDTISYNNVETLGYSSSSNDRLGKRKRSANLPAPKTSDISRLNEKTTTDAEPLIDIEVMEVEEEEEIFIIVEQMPKFQGDSIAAFRDYLNQRIISEIPKEKLTSGKIIIQFVVSKEGSIKDIKFLRSENKDLEEDILQIMKSAPLWTPGKQRGENVDVQFFLPITIE